MLRIRRVEVLVDRAELEAAQAERLHVVDQLLDAVGVVRVDRAPAGEPVRVLAHEVGDQLLRHVDAGEGRSQAEDDHPVAVTRRLQQRLGPGVEGVLRVVVVTGEVDVGRQPQLRPLRRQRRADELLGEMIRVPAEVRVGVYEHVTEPDPDEIGRRRPAFRGRASTYLRGEAIRHRLRHQTADHGRPPASTRSDALSPERPLIDKPEGDIPFDLGIEDILVGDGDEAVKGKKVSVHYAGVAFSTGEEFDASWNRGQPFQFKLGKGQVIPGWDAGVEGMKVGGRRKLTIPSAMAYGARGAGGVIKPHEPLVFVVDLLSVD